MKLRHLIPLYLVLGIITFYGRKVAEGKEQAKKTQKEIAQIYTQTNNHSFMEAKNITGKIELDTTSNRLYADIWMDVASAEFKYAEDFMVLQTPDNYKGIVFQYFNNKNNEPDGGNPAVPMHIVFDCENTNSWKVDDTVRIMSLNEKEHTVFEGLKPYFEERMSKFKNKSTTLADLITFNDEWNRLHPNNHVNTVESINQHESDSTDNEGFRIMTPRLTKDGSMLSITRRK